jgi:hypothetical protein
VNRARRTPGVTSSRNTEFVAALCVRCPLSILNAIGAATKLVEHHWGRARVHVLVSVEATKRIERTIYIVDTIIRNIDWGAVIDLIFGQWTLPLKSVSP